MDNYTTTGIKARENGTTRGGGRIAANPRTRDNRKQETKGKGHDMNTEYYNSDTYDIETAEFEHYDGTRHALLCAMIREAENRTYCAPLHEETPEAKAAARAIWQTFNYLVQIINELEYTDNEHIQHAAAYEEATEAEEHAYNYNTAHMSENSATAEYEARDNLDETQRKAAEFVMEDVTPRNIEVSNAAAYYRYKVTDTEPYMKPMKQNKAF